jgi:hypothetical protein
MPFFNGTIYKDDGSVCCEQVMVSLEQAERTGGPEWYGTVQSRQAIDLVAGKRYRLLLADGRTGDFTVRRNTSAGGEARAIAIQGMSPLK